MSAVSRSSRLAKYRYSADDTMPMSRATARSDRFAPSAARWRRATVLISSVISARIRALMDCAGMGKIIAHIREHCSCICSGVMSDCCLQQRAALSNTGGARVSFGAPAADAPRSAAPRTEQEKEVSEHVIVGAGAVGSAAAKLLAERGEHVRIVSRR